MKFTIECEMNERWTPYFLAMLESMRRNGAVGHSGWVSLFADGDGDFRPKFSYDKSLTKDVNPLVCNSSEVKWDAG